MPVRDVDSGMIWQGYNPSIITHQQAPEPYKFYFGGSQVPTADLGIEVGRIGMRKPVVPRVRKTMTGVIRKLPSVRK